jgi:protein gp37
MKMAARIERMAGAPQYNGTTKSSRAGAVWTGKVSLAENALLQPLKRKKPTMYFVNSMGDLFHEDVPDAWIDQVFAVMALCPQHTFQVLTKRSKRMRSYLSSDKDLNERIGQEAHQIDWKRAQELLNCFNPDDIHIYADMPLPNVWLGVSAEDQIRWDERTPDLCQTPAAVRFVSAEPLLGSINGRAPYAGANVDILRGAHPAVAPVDWVIVGGESGKGARPMHPDWARSIRNQCVKAGVAFFFKQWGEWADCTDEFYIGPTPKEERIFTATGEVLGVGVPRYGQGAVDPDWKERGGAWMCRVGKKPAGRMLDGCEWNEVPE